MIDWKRPIRTRSGYSARVLCVDRIGEYPVIALITCKDGPEVVASYTAEGRYHSHLNVHDNDLFNVPEIRSGVVNLYNGGPGVGYFVGNIIHPDAAVAKQQAACNGFQRVGSAPIEFEVPAC